MVETVFTDVADERFAFLNRMLDEEYFRQFGNDDLCVCMKKVF
ncbi:hypothetical protein [Christensenella timonensis]|nr:hypothetical protein [Christensenella timonensis]